MVNKYGRSNKSSISWSSPMDRSKAWSWTGQLVHTDDLTRSSGLAYSFDVINTFEAPLKTMCFSVSTTGTSRRVNRLEFTWNYSTAGHKLKDRETEMPQRFMNGEEA